ncbi:hypothetical protein PGTUg99_016543 [Puccinia graminis f. sp. tritici]|uniref:Uncharacterized protein n=1 Tax=Puccinia graminis f. sp. tritici TaxID=56615 RepID=A0A5B0Q8U1_PUCGR|nr:hypothetical protein PGTUg99_016543 [Puccinia graminis f. sp. tritici]
MSLRFFQLKEHAQRLANFDEEVDEHKHNLMNMLFEDSEKEMEDHKCQPILNRIPNKNQNALAGHKQLMNDYLVKISTNNSASYFIQQAGSWGSQHLSRLPRLYIN